MRYGLSVVAEVLRRQVTVDEEPLVAHRLMQIANKICTDRTLNEFDPSVCTGPSVFLVKLIIRQYGIACLEKIIPNHPWVMPEILQNEGQVCCMQYSWFLYMNDVNISLLGPKKGSICCVWT